MFVSCMLWCVPRLSNGQLNSVEKRWPRHSPSFHLRWPQQSPFPSMICPRISLLRGTINMDRREYEVQPSSSAAVLGQCRIRWRPLPRWTALPIPPGRRRESASGITEELLGLRCSACRDATSAGGFSRGLSLPAAMPTRPRVSAW